MGKRDAKMASRSSRQVARLRHLAPARQPSLASRAKAGGRCRDWTYDLSRV